MDSSEFEYNLLSKVNVEQSFLKSEIIKGVKRPRSDSDDENHSSSTKKVKGQNIFDCVKIKLERQKEEALKNEVIGSEDEKIIVFDYNHGLGIKLEKIKEELINSPKMKVNKIANSEEMLNEIAEVVKNEIEIMKSPERKKESIVEVHNRNEKKSPPLSFKVANVPPKTYLSPSPLIAKPKPVLKSFEPRRPRQQYLQPQPKGCTTTVNIINFAQSHVKMEYHSNSNHFEKSNKYGRGNKSIVSKLCKKCNRLYNIVNGRNTHEPCLNNIPCPFCDRFFATEYSLNSHHSAVHGPGGRDPVNTEPEPECFLCERVFATEDGLRSHNKAVHSHGHRKRGPQALQPTVSCHRCPKICNSFDDLKNHIQMEHN